MDGRAATVISAGCALAFLIVGCSDDVQEAPADRDAGELEVVPMNFDEDAPVGVGGAYEASDYVVIGTIASVTDGVRFYGDDVDDPDPANIIFEDVALNVSVHEVLKGDPASTISVNWPAYITTSRASSDRTAVLEVDGVILNAEHTAGTYVMFLTHEPEPFGLGPVALSTAMIELSADELAAGQISYGFEQYRGRSLTEILEDAGIGR